MKNSCIKKLRFNTNHHENIHQKSLTKTVFQYQWRPLRPPASYDCFEPEILYLTVYFPFFNRFTRSIFFWIIP